VCDFIASNWMWGTKSSPALLSHRLTLHHAFPQVLPRLGGQALPRCLCRSCRQDSLKILNRTAMDCLSKLLQININPFMYLWLKWLKILPHISHSLAYSPLGSFHIYARNWNTWKQPHVTYTPLWVLMCLRRLLE
jgi:hypothetical protein